jgi:PAS domain S-box-containing protein
MAQPLKVLIVEDSPDDAELTLHELRRAGFAPIWSRVETEPDFLHQLQTLPDIILCDYSMPHFNGLRAADLVRQSGLNIPFILISGTVGEDVAVEAMKRGATDYLLKDRIARLGNAVERTLEQQRLRQQQHEAEAELRRTHEMLRQMLAHSPVVTYTLRIEEGKVIPLLVSENIERLLGFTVNEALSYDWWPQGLHPQDRERAATRLAGDGMGHSTAIEYRLRHKNGTYLWIEDSFRIVPGETGHGQEIVGVWTDINDRKRAEQATWESERRFREMLENVELIAMTLDRAGTVTFCNNHLLRLTGWNLQEVVGKDWFARFIPESSDEFKQNFLAYVNAGTVPAHYENAITTRNGGLREIVWNNTMLRDVGGNVIGTASIGEDVTDRKRLERERWRLEAQLRQQQKLESIGTLAGGVAHEINNPINGIMNYAQLIQDRLPADSPLVEYTGEILHETQRIATIVLNLLTFARDEKQSHTPASIGHIVEGTLSLIRTVIRHDQISLTVNIPPDLPQLKCRSQQIQQVLMNLMTNARDALNERYAGYDENKTLKVSAAPFEKNEELWVRITVEDHGTGIPPEVRERMFDPFFTTKPRDQGTGLGLSISHGIVKEHDGELTVESEPGSFTRLHLCLPVNPSVV